MNTELRDIWVYLSTSPLLHLTLTLLAYLGGRWLHRRSGGLAVLNPVLLAVLGLVTLLWATDTSYTQYFAGAQFVHFLLGPATVALAIPLYRQVCVVRRSLPGLLAAITLGSLTASISAVLLGRLAGASDTLLLSLAPKSVTTPIAMGITERLGGLPSLTAVLVILTGILGAMIGPGLLRLVGISDSRAQGIALGTASHGIGTARAVQIDETASAFAGLAMGLNALATALLLPLLWRWLAG